VNVKINGLSVWENDAQADGVGQIVLSVFDDEGRQLSNVRLPIELADEIDLRSGRTIKQALVQAGGAMRKITFD
jgi:hypothetical protein